jgi:hypothetical protein
MLSTLVDDWSLLASDERKALVAEIFEEITASELGIVGFLPREAWKPYLLAVVPIEAAKVPTERKTGVKHAEVVTVRLARDERGWLRLAG